MKSFSASNPLFRGFRSLTVRLILKLCNYMPLLYFNLASKEIPLQNNFYRYVRGEYAAAYLPLSREGSERHSI